MEVRRRRGVKSGIGLVSWGFNHKQSMTFIPICPYTIYSSTTHANRNYTYIIYCSVVRFWIAVLACEISPFVFCLLLLSFCFAARLYNLYWVYVLDVTRLTTGQLFEGLLQWISLPRSPKTPITRARHPHVTTAWINTDRWSKEQPSFRKQHQTTQTTQKHTTPFSPHRSQARSIQRLHFDKKTLNHRTPNSLSFSVPLN